MKHHKGGSARGRSGLVGEGPQVAIRIENSHNFGARDIMMMVDTGAGHTCVDNRILQGVGLIPISYTQLVGVSGEPKMRPVYMVNFYLGVESDAGEVGSVQLKGPVVGVPKSESYQGLIGRDFLSNMVLYYDGLNGQFELRYNPPPTSQ